MTSLPNNFLNMWPNGKITKYDGFVQLSSSSVSRSGNAAMTTIAGPSMAMIVIKISATILATTQWMLTGWNDCTAMLSNKNDDVVNKTTTIRFIHENYTGYSN